MHPVIMRHFAAERIREMHARAENEHLARQARQARQTRQASRARRRAPSTRLRLPASGTLTYFHEADRGGHFAAWEEPELFATEIRAAFKPLR